MAKDAIIMENTKAYAKYGVLKNVEKQQDVDKLAVKQIYVVEQDKNTQGTEEGDNSWQAVLVDSFCQAGKTKKCFEILDDKIQKSVGGNTLVLFITQSNSTASANQVIQRAKVSASITTHITSENILKSGAVPTDGVCEDNYMVVDFWNSRNMDNMISFVRENNDIFNNIIIVIDECEQGYQKGLKERLNFIRKIEKCAPESLVKVIFVTATVANLSKSILQIANADMARFNCGVVSDIINKPVVEHQFAEPHATYVGASWFKNTPEVWTRLVFPKKSADVNKDEYAMIKLTTVMEAVNALPANAKEMTLFVTSTRTCDHESLASRLYRCGYNVTVELNGTNSKNFRVKFINKSGGITKWDIPFSQIDSKADKGDLTTYRNPQKRLVQSGISQKNDYTMAHVLQAALFMMTDAEDRIKRNITNDEFLKLEALSNAISNLDRLIRRPDDFPDRPKVALIAGHLVGRGITIQNPYIDFTCTSFCFTDTRDTLQRGATNTQRFGRACGMLMDVYVQKDRKPVLIATDGIMRDALANEMALREKADEIQNGTLFALKDMVTAEEWTNILKKTNNTMQQCRQNSENINRDVAMNRLLSIISNSPQKTANLSRKVLEQVDIVLCNYMKKHHNKLLNDMMVANMVESPKKSYWRILPAGELRLMKSLSS